MNLIRTGLAPLLTLLFSACQAAPPAGASPGQIEHMVLIWLKQPGNMVTKQRMAETARAFPSQIDGIVCMSIGEPVSSGRPSDDASFDMALVMRFVSKAALDAYLIHPVHVRAVDEVLTPNVAKVITYDSRVL